MIGSLLSRMSDAEKLSPQQLQQTVKDGVLPAGIASMISQDDAGEHSMPSAPPPGTVADQVINQADQALSPEDKIMQHINLLKRDISKIQEGVQSGEIKAYEGIPLLKEKVNQLGKLQAMLQPQMPQQMPQMPPQAPQAPQAPQGINTAQSNLPTQMAEGGIVNFAKGGKAFIDADEENDDLSGEEDYQNALKMHRDAQLRRQQEQESYNQPMGEGMGSAIMSVADKTKPNYSSFVNKTPDVQQAYKKETGGIQDIINAKAQKYNLPPALLHSIAKAESGLDPNAGNKTGSSAKGLYQFIDTTWKGMGGKEGEQFDPDINSEMGAKYIRQNAEFLKNKLGRNPTYSEVYGAHFFGPTGAAALLSKGKPDMPIEQGLATFESGKRVKTIMNQNPNLKGKTIGQVFGDLESKAGQGIVSLARGGVIQHYETGNLIEDKMRLGPRSYGVKDSTFTSTKTGPNALERFFTYDPVEQKKNWEIGKTARENFGLPADQKKPYPDEVVAPKKVVAKNPIAAPTSSNPSMTNNPTVNLPDYTNDVPYGTETRPVPEEQTSDGITSLVNPTGYSAYNYGNFLNRMLGQSEDLKKQKDEDRYMALLAAGLGMAGGTSPYAAANIGQGALAGVQNLSESNKTRAAQQVAIDKNMLGALHYGNVGEYYQNLSKLEQAKQDELAQHRKDQLALKPTAEQLNYNKTMELINNDDRIAAALKERQELVKSGTLTPGTPEYNAYDAYVNKIKKAYLDQAGIKQPYVSVPPMSYPAPAPKRQGFFEGIFGGSKTPPPLPPGFELQQPKD